MTKKDLFRIILKVLGIYFGVTVLFNTLPNMVLFLYNSPLLSVVLTLVVIALFVGFFCTLVFNPDFYIKALKLERGLDDDTLLVKQVSLDNLLKGVVFCVGVALIIKQLPSFVVNVVFLFKLLLSNRTGISSQVENSILKDYLGWGVKIVSLAVGYLMATNYSSIARFFKKADDKNNVSPQ